MNAVDAYKKFGNGTAAAKAMGVPQTTFYRKLREERGGQKLYSGGVSEQPRYRGGIDELRTKFGKAEIERRRVSRNQEKIDKFISSTLKSKIWMPDAEVRCVLGLPSAEFSILRQDYIGLTMDAMDENRKKVLLWVHPDHMDEAREIINGTK